MIMMMTVHTAVHQIMAIHALHAAEARDMKTKMNLWEVIPVEEITDATAAALAVPTVEATMKALLQDVMAAEAIAITMKIMVMAPAAPVNTVTADTEETPVNMAEVILPAMKVVADIAVAAEAEPMADAALTEMRVEIMVEVRPMTVATVQVPAMVHQTMMMTVTMAVAPAVLNGEKKEVLRETMDKAADMEMKDTNQVMDAAAEADMEAAAEVAAMADAEDNMDKAAPIIHQVMEIREAMAQVPVTAQADMARAAQMIGMKNKQ